MNEIYETTDASRDSTTITGTATYSNYRVPPPAVASLTVAWDPSVDDGVVGYSVEWGETSGDYSDASDVGKVSQFRIEGLVEGETYYVVVRAYTTAGIRGIPSDETSGIAVLSSGIARQ